MSSTTPSFSQEQVIHNVGVVRAHIAEVCGDAASSVKLVAVTKNFGPEAWEWAKDAGCDAVGENYAQEALAKALATHTGVLMLFPSPKPLAPRGVKGDGVSWWMMMGSITSQVVGMR